MSTLEALILTAVIAALIGAAIGARNVRRRAGNDILSDSHRTAGESMRRTHSGTDSGRNVPSSVTPPTAPRIKPTVGMPVSDRNRTQSAIVPSGRIPSGASLRRTPVLDSMQIRPNSGVTLRISTMAGDAIRARDLPDGEGLTIGPMDADIHVPELPTKLILGRSGYVWTVQAAGPVDLSVTLDGVPLTSVPMPWTAGRQLTAGPLTLTLDNAPTAPPSFREPAATVHSDYAFNCAAGANPQGLVIGRSNGQDASALVAAALAALDPSILDPARAAALAALNVTLAVRDALPHQSDDFSAEPPNIAVLSVDGSGKLRAAANFDVSVWAITGNARIPLSSHLPDEITPLEVVPLDLHVATGLGEHPILMLTAGASLDVLSKQLTDCRTSSPQHLVASVVASRAVIMAAAAVVEKPEVLHGGSPRMRTREASHRWKP